MCVTYMYQTSADGRSTVHHHCRLSRVTLGVAGTDGHQSTHVRYVHIPNVHGWYEYRTVLGRLSRRLTMSVAGGAGAACAAPDMRRNIWPSPFTRCFNAGYQQSTPIRLGYFLKLTEMTATTIFENHPGSGNHEGEDSESDSEDAEDQGMLPYALVTVRAFPMVLLIDSSVVGIHVQVRAAAKKGLGERLKEGAQVVALPPRRQFLRQVSPSSI